MDYQEILAKLYRYCAYQDRSRWQISQKLREWEVDLTLEDQILQHLRDERFWDEQRFAESFARGKFTLKRWGKQKIRVGLRQHRVDAPLIEWAIGSQISPAAYQNALSLLIFQKNKQWRNLDKAARKPKIIRFLQQKGYDWADIKLALEQESEED